VKKDPVLIVSSPMDYHARACAWAIEQYGYRVSLFDTAGVGSPLEWWEFEADGDDMRVHRPNQAFQFSSVWDRRRFPKDFDPLVYEPDQEFVAQESRAFDRNILKLYEERSGWRWIDRMRLVERAENKLEQLVVAREAGLNIPSTLISRNYERIVAFANHYPRVVVKPFRGHLWVQDGKPKFEAIATCIEGTNNLSEQAVSVCPAIYQQAVDKIADIRVVVIGRDIFATRYSLRAGHEGNFDSRVNMRNEDITLAMPVALDVETANGLLRVIDCFGITYASADFAEDRNGKLYFLDLNPQGQFLFNEHFVPEFKLLDAMARHIIGANELQDTRVLGLTADQYDQTSDHALFKDQLMIATGNAVQPKPMYSNEKPTDIFT
jgi:glutathione synthase/RimK-type ligase-like ATP-grasp enzyme